MSIFFRLIARVQWEWEKIRFRPFVMVRNVDGEPINVYINNLFAKWWYTNIHAWPELRWLRENMLELGDVVFDCGANNGYTSVFFAKAVGSQGLVYAFEPHPLNIEAIYKNVELNNVSNVKVISSAVGSKHGTLSFSRHPNASISREKGAINVDVVLLDDFIMEVKPTFIKIDVEGFELEVLRGAKEILKYRPKLDLEIHCANFQDREKTLLEIFELIDFESYKSWIQLDPKGSIDSFDLNVHTVEKVISHNVVHIFLKPSK